LILFEETSLNDSIHREETISFFERIPLIHTVIQEFPWQHTFGVGEKSVFP
jgi:hypothetical protein